MKSNIKAISTMAVIAALITGTATLAVSTPLSAFAQSAATIHYQQGVVTSSHDPLRGHYMHQAAVILPPRSDGQVYSGILTFTASKQVEVVVLQTLSTNTSKIDQRFGSILTAPLPPTNKTELGIVLITPDYGSTPVASVSIPFVGNALALHTLSGQPFVASYSVSYTLGRPQYVNHVGPVDKDIASSMAGNNTSTASTVNNNNNGSNNNGGFTNNNNNGGNGGTTTNNNNNGGNGGFTNNNNNGSNNDGGFTNNNNNGSSGGTTNNNNNDGNNGGTTTNNNM
jgi:hypothetical protein